MMALRDITREPIPWKLRGPEESLQWGGLEQSPEQRQSSKYFAGFSAPKEEEPRLHMQMELCSEGEGSAAAEKSPFF